MPSFIFRYFHEVILGNIYLSCINLTLAYDERDSVLIQSSLFRIS